jgi:hypothetical protein
MYYAGETMCLRGRVCKKEKRYQKKRQGERDGESVGAKEKGGDAEP